MKLSELAATKWTGRDVKIATAVALAESRGKMDATNTNTNGTTDDGPWQVNSVHGYDRNRLRTDPAYTVAAAHEVWQKQGWRAWVTYKTGAYLAFMGQDADLTADDPSLAEKIGRAILGPVTGSLVPDSVAEGVAGGALGPIGGAVVTGQNPLDGMAAVGRILTSLTDPSTWMRIGKGYLGGVLIVLGVGGIVFVVANRAQSTPAGQAVISAVPVGRAATTAKAAAKIK